MLTTVSAASHDLPALDLSSLLERGHIVEFPRCPIALPDAADQEFLRTRLAQGQKRKNVSWYPVAQKLVGYDAPDEDRARAQRLLAAHSARVREFLSLAIPRLVPGWTVGTCSFRPMQEKGRALPSHASNELVHVDAGAYGATHGDRVLRFFVNLNPVEDRLWISKGTFRELYEKHADAAGLRGHGVRDSALMKAWSGAVRGAARAFPMLRSIDSSAYDRLMRRFHNYMKDDPGFRDSAEGLQQFAFKPYSAWMVLTDTVSHACISGQHAFVDTFVIPLKNCTQLSEAPFHVLARGAA